MDDKGLSKQPFYNDVVTGACRPGGPKRRYKGTLKNFLKGLHINPETWEDLTQNRTSLPSTDQIGSSPPKPRGRFANHRCLASSVPTIRRLQYARAYNAHSTHESILLDTFVPQATSTRQFLTLRPPCLLPQPPPWMAIPVTAGHTVAAPRPPSVETIRSAPTPESTIAASSASSTTSLTFQTAGTTSDVPLSATITASTPTSSDVDLVPICPHCDRKLTTRIVLVGHL
ncbi:hypothetical protein SprV_0200736500 [Sparganum proliferum]